MELFHQGLRVAAVIALLCISAALATPPGRLPLALRGIKKIMRKDQGLAPDKSTEATVSPRRRFLAFLVALLAVAVAVF
ncbi:MAG: hypothetical protein IKC27_06115 [Kiritimatiellae bacterium]|nr:hypothetical protein [Kiritimatiellia bacterium]